MRAEELRIGNYLDGRTGFLVVEEIRKDGCRVKIKDRRSSFIVCGESPCLTPIPLTEEWLVKFGFEYERSDVYRLNEEYHLEKTGTYEYNFLYVDGWLRTIKHVHQLQNLYFALTNEELKLKQNESI